MHKAQADFPLIFLLRYQSPAQSDLLLHKAGCRVLKMQLQLFRDCSNPETKENRKMQYTLLSRNMAQLRQEWSQNTCIQFLEKTEIWVQNTQLTSMKSKSVPGILKVNWEHWRRLLLQGIHILWVSASVQKCWVQDDLQEESKLLTTQQELVEGGTVTKTIYWDPLLAPQPTTFVHADIPSSIPNSLSPALKRKSGLRLKRRTCPTLAYILSYILSLYIYIWPSNTKGRSRNCSFQPSALFL